MALDENEIYLPARGHIYTASPDTSAPSDLESFNLTDGDTDWESIGHTASDELPEFGYDGGDTSNIGSWQMENIRTIQTEATADYLIFNVHQFNNTTLGFYYGGDGGTTSGRFEVAGGAEPGTDTALLVIIDDGVNGRIGFHAPNASVRRNDSISMETDNFAYLPLRADFQSTGEYKFAWIAPELGPSTS